MLSYNYKAFFTTKLYCIIKMNYIPHMNMYLYRKLFVTVLILLIVFADKYILNLMCLLWEHEDVGLVPGSLIKSFNDRFICPTVWLTGTAPARAGNSN